MIFADSWLVLHEQRHVELATRADEARQVRAASCTRPIRPVRQAQPVAVYC